MRQVESHAGDGRGGVIANARQAANGTVLARKTARSDNLLGRPPQVARARVIAEPAPKRQHIRLSGCRQRFNRGEACQEPLVIRDHRCRPGLLQHDFGNPYAVRVGGAPPGKIAMAVAVPGEQQIGEADVHSMTRSHSATTAKPSGSTSQASNSGFSGSRRISSCRHWSSPLDTFLLVYFFTV